MAGLAHKICMMANEGNLHALKEEAMKGHDVVHVSDNDDMTPLHHAAAEERDEIVRYLLSKGADIEAMDLRRETPLHKAARSKNDIIVKILLEMGADPISQNNRQEIPLFHVCIEPCYAVAEELVTAMMDKGHQEYISCADVDKSTPLQYAAKSVHNKEEAAMVVHLLLQNDARYLQRNKPGMAAIHEAAKVGNYMALEKLLEYHHTDGDWDISMVSTGNDWTALHYACHMGWVDCARLLIDKGVNVNVQTNNGKTAYDIARSSNVDPVTKRELLSLFKKGPKGPGEHRECDVSCAIM